MECIPFLYFLVICGVLYLIGRQNGPDCLERAERYVEEKGKKWWVGGLGMLRVPQGCNLAQRSHAEKQVNPKERGLSKRLPVYRN
jgi:hypothetical protein